MPGKHSKRALDDSLRNSTAELNSSVLACEPPSVRALGAWQPGRQSRRRMRPSARAPACACVQTVAKHNLPIST
eukprot:6214478-Pleurochrysis_carterae.AAC.1